MKITTVTPGGDLVFTGTVSNAGPTVGVPGLAQLINPTNAPVNITDASASIEVLGVASGEWRALTEASSTSTRFAAVIDGAAGER